VDIVEVCAESGEEADLGGGMSCGRDEDDTASRCGSGATGQEATSGDASCNLEGEEGFATAMSAVE